MEDVYKEVFKKPHPKSRKLFNHYSIDTPNDTHQIDLLFMPTDNGYKYILTLVDIASRFKAGIELKNKYATTILEALKQIYKKHYITIPKNLNMDSGTEFKNKILKDWADENNVNLQYNNKGFHLAFVERFNGELAKKLFKPQFLKELKTQKPNTEWVNKLQSTIKKMNNTKTRMINLKPIDAIQMTKVEQKKNNFSPKDLKVYHKKGTIVRRLLNKDEILDIATGTITIEKRRATDPYYSLDRYEVVDSIKHCDECLYYHIIKKIGDDEVFKHTFTYWELQVSHYE